MDNAIETLSDQILKSLILLLIGFIKYIIQSFKRILN